MNLKKNAEVIGRIISEYSFSQMEKISEILGAYIEPHIKAIIFMEYAIAYVFIAGRFLSLKMEYISRNEIMNKAINLIKHYYVEMTFEYCRFESNDMVRIQKIADGFEDIFSERETEYGHESCKTIEDIIKKSYIRIFRLLEPEVFMFATDVNDQNIVNQRDKEMQVLIVGSLTSFLSEFEKYLTRLL